MTRESGGILMTMHRMSQGGADRVAVLLANGFQAAGIPTNFLLLRSGGEGEDTLTGMFDGGVRVHAAGPPMGSRHLELLRGVAAIRTQITKLRPSLVLATSSNMGLVTGVACRSHGGSRPSVAMKLTNPVLRPQDRLATKKAYRTKLYRFVFSRYDRILTLSDPERSDLCNLYPDLFRRFITVPNAYLSDAMLAATPSRLSRAAGPVRLITLARMMPQKRLDVLLRAFAFLDNQDVRLTILGDGPLRSSLETLASSLGIRDRVEMPGFIEDVAPMLRSADLFVLSSDYEGLPAAVIEALACNIPVVTTECFPGARAMIGWSPYCAVVPIGDPAALAIAITKVLAKGPASDLQEIVADYGIEASIAAHIAALRPLMEKR